MKQRSLLLKLHNMSSFETNEQETFDTMFCDGPNRGKSVSPTVVKVNPTNPSNGYTHIHLPSTVEFEAEEETPDLPDDISGEWAMEDDDIDNDSSTDCCPIQTGQDLAAESTPSLYSFYFEGSTMKVCEDDNSVALSDDFSLDYAGDCLETIRGNPECFWSDSAMFMTKENLSSPAQISLSSEAFSELQEVDTL